MSHDPTRQLSLLACVTGLMLAAVWFAALALGTAAPHWIPMMIAAIGGFELFMFGQGVWVKRVQGGDRG